MKEKSLSGQIAAYEERIAAHKNKAELLLRLELLKGVNLNIVTAAQELTRLTGFVINSGDLKVFPVFGKFHASTRYGVKNAFVYDNPMFTPEGFLAVFIGKDEDVAYLSRNLGYSLQAQRDINVQFSPDPTSFCSILMSAKGVLEKAKIYDGEKCRTVCGHLQILSEFE